MHRTFPEFVQNDRPQCPGCQTRMITTGSVPVADSASEDRSFECLKCGHAETQRVATDSAATGAEDGVFKGELKWPDLE